MLTGDSVPTLATNQQVVNLPHPPPGKVAGVCCGVCALVAGAWLSHHDALDPCMRPLTFRIHPAITAGCSDQSGPRLVQLPGDDTACAVLTSIRLLFAGPDHHQSVSTRQRPTNSAEIPASRCGIGARESTGSGVDDRNRTEHRNARPDLTSRGTIQRTTSARPHDGRAREHRSQRPQILHMQDASAEPTWTTRGSLKVRRGRRE
ncbi:hypothetical protein BJ987_003492 [Nocardia goodfellowii]|uniref:Uncharacterized protein n=1 Tax=Nocardia goodfellowii TaxID=882446 RepID=A0ABS4QFW5_9NOCA|nr:hypothetical protein [Nocardia goodfellowii]